MKRLILALLIAGLVLSGMAFSTNYSMIVPKGSWLSWDYSNLTKHVPAYASGWGNATAFVNTTKIGGSGTAGDPYALTAVIIGSGKYNTFALNTHIDPQAGLNITVASVTAIGNNVTGSIPVNGGLGNIKNGGFLAAGSATAVGSALTEATAYRNAYTIGAFNATTVLTPTQAISATNGFASAIADYT